MNDSWGKSCPQSIQNCQNIDDFLADRTGYRSQMPRSSEDHADDTQRPAPHRTLERDDPHTTADMHDPAPLLGGFIHPHGPRRFRGYVAVLSDRHANRGGHHGRGVVDAIPHIKRLGCRCLLSDDSDLLFRTLLCVDFGYAHLLSKVAHLRLPIPRNDHQAREVMLRSQVTHEGVALRARRITKAHGRRVALVNQHHALKATGYRRELISASNFLRVQFVTAGDLYLMTGNGSAKALAGLFV